ncbi:hypothetical protein M8C21_032078 [Ambrosia artemisiifolia]|uniref:t-SNARE coiled-coil homology domain-containing protein n=1 Tax=Ambrosia artemisiifolia TaxID=4212 RepID=A0AAD5BXI3_AMBAR|nr:hypothetical protein M8C21_032078 [Ambrosia artemisiifolia]
MSYRRDNNRASRSALFDNLEEGGLRASSSSSYSDEQENEKSLNSLQDRVVFLKRLTGDIHEEVQSHNRMLDRMGNGMDSARGIMSGTMDKFKMVFEKKSSRRTCKLVIYLVLSFFIIYYLFRFLLPAANFIHRAKILQRGTVPSCYRPCPIPIQQITIQFKDEFLRRALQRHDFLLHRLRDSIM